MLVELLAYEASMGDIVFTGIIAFACLLITMKL